MSKINIQAIYDMFTKYPDVMVNYEEIKSTIIDSEQRKYFNIYVDLFRSLGRKPTIDEFNIGLITESANNMSIKGGKRRRIRKSKRRKSRRSKRRRGTKRRRYF
jgi:hypothetical protein